MQIESQLTNPRYRPWCHLGQIFSIFRPKKTQQVKTAVCLSPRLVLATMIDLTKTQLKRMRSPEQGANDKLNRFMEKERNQRLIPFHR